MIKHAIFMALVLLGLGGTGKVLAQGADVETAAMSCSRVEKGETDDKLGELTDAKKYIDRAEANPKAATFTKFWLTKGRVYSLIATDTQATIQALDADAAEKCVSAVLKYYELEKKSSYKKEAERYLINGCFGLANEASAALNAGDLAKAERYYDLIKRSIPYDSEEFLKKYNITENGMTNNLGLVAMQQENWDKVIQYFNTLVSKNYNSEMIYVYLEYAHLAKKDTASAFEIIKKGREVPAFSEKKVLIDEEIRLYVLTGRLNELIGKFNQAIELNPENATYYFNRAVVHDNLRGGLDKNINLLQDSVNAIDNKIRTTAKPDVKAKLNAQKQKVGRSLDSLKALSKDYDTKAEADYKKAIELEGNNADAQYNLGILYLNRANVLVDKMNSTNDDALYEKMKAEYNAKLKEVLPYIERAISIKTSEIDGATNQDMVPVYKSDKLLYLQAQQKIVAQLRDYDKLGEIKKEIEALEADLKSK